MRRRSTLLGSLPDISYIARNMRGEARGNQASVPGPGHSSKDRSLNIKVEANAPDGFLVHSFAGDDPIRCKDYVRDNLGLAPWRGRAKEAGTKSTDKSHRR